MSKNPKHTHTQTRILHQSAYSHVEMAVLKTLRSGAPLSAGALATEVWGKHSGPTIFAAAVAVRLERAGLLERVTAEANVPTRWQINSQGTIVINSV